MIEDLQTEYMELAAFCSALTPGDWDILLAGLAPWGWTSFIQSSIESCH